MFIAEFVSRKLSENPFPFLYHYLKTVFHIYHKNYFQSSALDIFLFQYADYCCKPNQDNFPNVFDNSRKIEKLPADINFPVF